MVFVFVPPYMFGKHGTGISGPRTENVGAKAMP